MAQMDRNINLEEINSDALFGISFLDHQSFFQKFIFFFGIIFAIGFMFVGTLFLNMDTLLLMIITFFPLIISVLFGCNYNEDLSVFKFVKLVMFNPVLFLTSKPTENIDHIKSRVSKVAQEEKALSSKKEVFTDEARSRIIKTLVFGILAFFFVLIVVVLILSSLKKPEIHHVVSNLISYTDL